MGKGGIVGRPTQTRFGRVGAGGGNPADRGGFPQQVNDLLPLPRTWQASEPNVSHWTYSAVAIGGSSLNRAR